MGFGTAWRNIAANAAATPAGQAELAQQQQAQSVNQQWGQQLQTQGAPQEVADYFRGYRQDFSPVTAGTIDPSTAGGWYQAAQNTARTGQGDWQNFRDSQGNVWAPNWEENGGYTGFKTAAEKGLMAGRDNSPDLYFDQTGKYSHGYNNAPGWLNPLTGILAVAGLGMAGQMGAFAGGAGGAGGGGAGATAAGVETAATTGAAGAAPTAAGNSIYSLGGSGTGFGGASTGVGMTAPTGFGTTGFGATTAGAGGVGLTAAPGAIGAGIGEGLLAGTGTMLGEAALSGATVLADGTVLAPAASYSAPVTSAPSWTQTLGGASSAASAAPTSGGSTSKTGGFGWQDLAGVGAQVFNGINGANAAGDASAAQLQAAREAMALTAPWREKGVAGLNKLSVMLGLDGQGSPEFGQLMKDFQFTQDDPSYQWRMNQGLKGVKNLYAGKGKFLSGAAMKGINDYAQGAASTEYGAAFNRDLATRTNMYNRLAGIAGTGQTASNTMGNLTTQAGDAQAAGTMGKANAYSDALSGAYNTYTQNQLMQQLLQRR
jgi:hypothetical protein